MISVIDRLPRLHGGPDARGAAQWDFSTNANAAGPFPAVLSALQRADATRYPDPGYHALRERLAAWHGVAPERIVLAASASEFIQRITAVGARIAPGPVQVPRHAYGDYAAAARAGGRAVLVDGDEHHGPAVSLRAMTTHSATAGCRARTASISPGSIRWPRIFTWWSSRPRNSSRPSARRDPRSP